MERWRQWCTLATGREVCATEVAHCDQAGACGDELRVPYL